MQAMAEMGRRAPDVIVMRESSRRINGDELCVRIRELSDVPIVVLGQGLNMKTGIALLRTACSGSGDARHRIPVSPGRPALRRDAPGQRHAQTWSEQSDRASPLSPAARHLAPDLRRLIPHRSIPITCSLLHNRVCLRIPPTGDDSYNCIASPVPGHTAFRRCIVEAMPAQRDCSLAVFRLEGGRKGGIG